MKSNLQTLFLLLSSFLLVSAQEKQCLVDGQCSGITVGLSTASSHDGCLLQCQRNRACHWITYLGDTQECILYYECSSIDNVCDNCVSSQVECQGPVCYGRGVCIGNFVGNAHAEVPTDCLLLCQEEPECHWYSFFPSTKECLLSADCLAFDGSCTECWSGERECQAVPVMSKLMSVGGHPVYNEVELADLTRNTSCSLAPYTLVEYGSVGLYIPGTGPMVCGGKNVSTTNPGSECATYDPNTNAWTQTFSMNTARSEAAAVQLSPTTWWVTGGLVGPMASTELFTVGAGFEPYVNLPEPKARHTLVKVDDNRIVLLGGLYRTSKVWLFDIEAETWEALPDLLQGTSQTQAGVAQKSDGSLEVVVVAGQDTDSTQIYSFSSNSWRLGPDFPEGNHYGGASVQFEETFLVVGGSVGKPIYQYQPDDESWTKSTQEMVNARSYSAVFRIPEDYINCL